MARWWRTLVVVGAVGTLGCPSPGRGMPPVGYTPASERPEPGGEGGGSSGQPTLGPTSSQAAGATAGSASPPTEAAPAPSEPPPAASPAAPASPRPLPVVVLYATEGPYARVGALVRRAVLDVRSEDPGAPVRWIPLGLPPAAPGLEAWLASQVPEDALIVRAPMEPALQALVDRVAAARRATVAHLLPVQGVDAAPSPASGTSGPVPLLGAWPLELRALFRAVATHGARTVALLLPEGQLSSATVARSEAARAGLQVTDVLGYAPRETAFARQAQRIAAARPDAVLLVGRAAEARLAAPALLLAGSRPPHRARQAAAARQRAPWAPTWLLPSAAWRPDQLAASLRPLLGALVAHRLTAEEVDRLEARHQRATGQRPRSAYLYQVAAAMQCLRRAARDAAAHNDAAGAQRPWTVARACQPRPERYVVLRLCERGGEPALCPLQPPTSPLDRRD